MVTWRKHFEETRVGAGDVTPVVAVAPNEQILDDEFSDGYGSPDGPDVLIWTEDRVYFPVTHDGKEWMDSVPRNPQPEAEGHVGEW